MSTLGSVSVLSLGVAIPKPLSTVGLSYVVETTCDDRVDG